MLWIGEVQPEFRISRSRFPQAMPGAQVLAVLGDTYAGGKRRPGRIVRHQRRQIAIGDVLQAFAIARVFSPCGGQCERGKDAQQHHTYGTV